jgi:hypothetical protein
MALRKREDTVNLKEEGLDGPLWRAGFVRGYGPVLRQTGEMNERLNE